MGLRTRIVFFDAGGTLLQVRKSVGTVYAEAATAAGWPTEPALVDESFRSAWVRSLERRGARDYACSDEILRAEWLEVVTDSLSPFVPEEVARRVFPGLYDHFASRAAWTLAPGTEETFDALGRMGVRVGLFSNWDSRLDRLLEEFGLLHRFAVSVVSYEVGIEKPHPGIFRIAQERAACRPEEIVHVGDSYEIDIAPASSSGFRALWLTREPSAPVPPGARCIDGISEVIGNID